MQEYTKLKLRLSLLRLMNEWWENEARHEENVPYVGAKTFDLMVDAAMCVLEGVDDIQAYFESEKMLK